MRELFVKTLPDMRSAKSYRNGKPKIKEPIYNASRPMINIDVDVSDADIAKMTDKQLKEAKAFAYLYLKQLLKLRRQLDLMLTLNPLSSIDTINVSLQLLIDNIDTVEKAIQNNNVKVLCQIMNSSTSFADV